LTGILLAVSKPVVAIAGASGFVGAALCEALARDYDLVGFSRGARSSSSTIQWRKCDLYSLLDLERGLAGCDYAIYLVHSMSPSTRMTQANFADLDLILSDNFARAAESCGVKQIIYLGGLVPEKCELSEHLASRLEVEHALRARASRVTTLRAGLIVGPQGSSLRILTRLVRRLPALATPKWAESATQPIALQDVVAAFQLVLRSPESYVGTFDIGGPEVMNYREMLLRTANVLHLQRTIYRVPFFTPGLSTLWISLITQTPAELVGPLIASLRHDMVAQPNRLQAEIVGDALPFEEALRDAVDPFRNRPRTAPSKSGASRTQVRKDRKVRSVQRLPLPPGHDAHWVALEYLRWLPTIPFPGLECRHDGDSVEFRLKFLSKPLLVLRISGTRTRSDRALLYIDGGLLAASTESARGRFEFREAPDKKSVLAAVHDFIPALPWPIYWATQAQIHLLVMALFSRHLARQGVVAGTQAPEFI
jgi:uncharacterized protein YbjT (DUF2867 family)